MSSRRNVRLEKELESFNEAPIEGISIKSMEKNRLKFICSIKGPKDTPYEKGTFYLNLEIPEKYPINSKIKFSFITPIFHPNISSYGRLCDFIMDSPAMTIPKYLLLISSLIANPIPDDPLEPEIAYLYRTDKAKFESIAKKWTELYAMKKE